MDVIKEKVHQFVCLSSEILIDLIINTEAIAIQDYF